MVWEEGFIGANSENLPAVDQFMFADYFSRVQLKEDFKVKAKAKRSNPRYKFKETIGRCRLKREAGCCTFKADITPELDVSLKPYTVSCKIDEKEETVVECTCDCSSLSPGVCTHVTSFISWIHCRNVEDTSSDRLICYSNESTLSVLRSTPRCMPITALFPNRNPSPVVEVSEKSCQVFFDKTVELLTESKSQCLFAMHLNLPETVSSIRRLVTNYINTVPTLHNQAFIEYCKTNISNERCQMVAEITKNKSDYFFNSEEKYGRITASRLHEVSKCQMADITARALVIIILGNQGPKDFSVKDKRIKLKRNVASVIGKTYATDLKPTGWIIKNSYPIFMASPDGLVKDHVVEIKVPSTKTSFNKYFSAGFSEPAPKYKAEIMLQMFLCDKQKSLFCVADPEFEVNKFVKIIEVNLDKDFLRYLLFSAEQFWNTFVYPTLYVSITEDLSNAE